MFPIPLKSIERLSRNAKVGGDMFDLNVFFKDAEENLSVSIA